MSFALYSLAIYKELDSIDRKYKINGATKFSSRKSVLDTNEDYKIDFCKLIFASPSQFLLTKNALEYVLDSDSGVDEKQLAKDLRVSVDDIKTVKNGLNLKLIVSFPWSLTTLLQVVGEIQRYDDIFNLACHY